MKKIFMFLIATMLMITNVAAQYGPTKFTDNVSVEVKGGVSTSMSDFYGGVSPIVGLQVEKYMTPWLGVGIDANTLIANPYGSANPHTAFDLVNINGLAKFNVRNMRNYDGTRKFFEPVVFAGLGWGHRTCSESTNRNYLVFKTGVELNFILDKNKAWAARVTPAVVWGPASDLKLNKHNGAFDITVGIVYHFKNKDGNRHYTKIKVYDQAEVNMLNARINNLRNENKNMLNVINRAYRELSIEKAHKPKVVEIHRIDTVMLMPDLQFNINSATLTPTSQATIVKMAEYMKNNPDKKYTISGYASVEGTKEYNEKLSLARAEVVKEALVEHGVSSDILEVVGCGATDQFSTDIRGLNRIVIVEE